MSLFKFFAGRRARWLLLALASLFLLCLPKLPVPGLDRTGQLVSVLSAAGAGGLLSALMLIWSPGLLDIYPRRKTLRIILESAPPLLLYMLCMPHWHTWLAQVPGRGLRVAIGCAPVLLVLWTCWAFVRYLRLLDELQQRVELVSVALAAGLTCMAGAAAAIVHGAGVLVLPASAGLWLFPFLAVAYSLIRAALTRGYE